MMKPLDTAKGSRQPSPHGHAGFMMALTIPVSLKNRNVRRAFIVWTNIRRQLL